MVRHRPFAVFTSRPRSNVVGCSTGREAGGVSSRNEPAAIRRVPLAAEAGDVQSPREAFGLWLAGLPRGA